MNVRERVNELLSEDCKGKLDKFDDFENVIRTFYWLK